MVMMHIRFERLDVERKYAEMLAMTRTDITKDLNSMCTTFMRSQGLGPVCWQLHVHMTAFAWNFLLDDSNDEARLELYNAYKEWSRLHTGLDWNEEIGRQMFWRDSALADE